MLAATVSIVSVTVSLLLVAWQSRMMAKQTEMMVQTSIAGASETALFALHPVLMTFVEQPRLRTYFYDGVEPPSGDDGVRVAAIAELLADCVNSGCETATAMPIAAQNLIGWRDFGSHLIENSPAVRRLVSEHPSWYPELAALESSG